VTRILGIGVRAAALFWLWMLLVGEWSGVLLVAGAIVAVLGARVGRPGRRVLARSWTVPWEIVADFGIVLWALVRSVVRRRPVRGGFHVRRRYAGDAGWVMWLATLSPNAYVVDVDEEAGTVLVHDLVTRRASEEPP
jgi:multisubunit Na+/H+ antiporter MnhE subunit